MRRAFILVLAAALTLAACSSKSKPDPIPATPTSARTSASTTEFAGVRPDAYVDSGDYVNGRHVATLTALDETSISFDAVQFLTGEAAQQAYQEDAGAELDSDFYVRNQNPLVRTLPLAADVVIRVNNSGGYPPNDPGEGHEVNVSTLKSYFDAGPAKSGYFWLTIKGGAVTAIEEQFVP
jgi:hypothetical protein